MYRIKVKGETDMMITVHCDRTDCYCNEDGYCEADLGIQIDSIGECETYEEREDIPMEYYESGGK